MMSSNIFRTAEASFTDIHICVKKIAFVDVGCIMGVVGYIIATAVLIFIPQLHWIGEKQNKKGKNRSKMYSERSHNEHFRLKRLLVI